MEQRECVSENQLAAYLRRDQNDAEIIRIEEHLVVCRACRLSLLGRQAIPAEAAPGFQLPAKLKQKVGRLPLRQSARFARWPQAPAFAIAALFLIAITAGGVWQFTRRTERQSMDGEALRADRKRQISLKAISPAENAALPTPTLEFKWSPEKDALRYTVVVLDESGDVRHQAETTEDHVTIDTNRAQLAAGKKYFWRVRAKLSDGTEAETPPAAFYINAK